MPLRNTDAKCPSALHMSGMTEDGKFTPEAVAIPLFAYERMFATTSPVVAFTKSPLRRGTSAFKSTTSTRNGLNNERWTHPDASRWTRVPNGP